MNTLAITKILCGSVRGSSRPVIAQTQDGKYLVKLRGTAQGSGALVAEIVVAKLAEALNLPVLPRHLVILNQDTPIDDKDDELADLLAASIGINLAYPMIDNGRDAKVGDFNALTAGEQAAVLWLDRFVMNPDRTNQNPNILCSGKALYLIDHGAALRFQYDWQQVTEDTPLATSTIYSPHIFERESELSEWKLWDEQFAKCITRATLEEALEEVPDKFLQEMLPAEALEQPAAVQQNAIARRRAAYVAFLWKRLKSPRQFALEPAKYLESNSSKDRRKANSD